MEIRAVHGRGDKTCADGVIAEAFAVPALALVSGEDRVEICDDRIVVEIVGVELGKPCGEGRIRTRRVCLPTDRSRRRDLRCRILRSTCCAPLG